MKINKSLVVVCLTLLLGVLFLAACRGGNEPAATTPQPAVNTPAPGGQTPQPGSEDELTVTIPAIMNPIQKYILSKKIAGKISPVILHWIKPKENGCYSQMQMIFLIIAYTTF